MLAPPAPPHVYLEQLTSILNGEPLWRPEPNKKIYDQVMIGDVGYVSDGFFYRAFNALLPWDNPLNDKHDVSPPERYKPLDMGPFGNIHRGTFPKGYYYSRNVSAEKNAGNTGTAVSGDAEGVTFKSERLGALLFIPHDGHCEDVIRPEVFQDYVRDNVDSWFAWAQKNSFDVERMEDLILVSGCTLVSSWAVAAFVDHDVDPEISLVVQKLDNGGASLAWEKVRGNVARDKSNPNNPPTTRDQCISIRGFRAKRFSWISPSAAPQPLPGEGEIQVARDSDVSKHREPLTGVLNYIASTLLTQSHRTSPEDNLAIAHHDDFQRMGKVETPSADAMKKSLEKNQIPVSIKNGAATVRDDTPPVPCEKRATFYATAELQGEPVPFILHPVLATRLLKLETCESIDYDLYEEEITSPAVHPPVPSLRLENHQGYPKSIIIQASGGSPDYAVTVQDVLMAIHEDLRKLLHRHAWNELTDDERAAIIASFKERCKAEEELSKGIRRVDLLRGRNRLQILTEFSPDDDISLSPTIPFKLFEEFPFSRDDSDESKVASTSRVLQM